MCEVDLVKVNYIKYFVTENIVLYSNVMFLTLISEYVIGFTVN